MDEFAQGRIGRAGLHSLALDQPKPRRSVVVLLTDEDDRYLVMDAATSGACYLKTCSYWALDSTIKEWLKPPEPAAPEPAAEEQVAEAPPPTSYSGPNTPPNDDDVPF